MPPPRRISRRVGLSALGGDRAPPRPRPLSDGAVCAGRPPRGAVRALCLQLRGRAGAREPSPSRCSARSGCNGGARSSRRPIPAGRRGGTRSSTPLVAAIARIRAVARAFRPDHRRARARSRRYAAGRSGGADRLCRGYLVYAAVSDAGGARGRRAGNDRRRRARSGLPMRWPGCCGRCRFTPLPDAGTSRRISRRGPGSIRQPMRDRRDTPALREATAELAETGAAHLAAARRSAGKPRGGRWRPCCRR